MLEIEVISTKKKLTKAVIKQLEPANVFDMENKDIDTCAYYIRGMGKGYAAKVGLFKSRAGWRTINLNNCKPSSKVGVYIGNGMTVQYADEETRDRWLTAYDNIKRMCLKNHLII